MTSYQYSKDRVDDLHVGHCDQTGSTTADARKLLQSGTALPFVLFAKEQTGGVGRRGRSWSSPAGNCYFSLCLDAESVASHLHGLLPKLVAFSLARFCDERFGIRLTIKWPNDLLFGGHKLAGILCETSTTKAGLGPFIIGVGFNINLSPKLEEQKTTCLKEILVSEQNIDVALLGEEIALKLLRDLRSLQALGSRYYDLQNNDLWCNGKDRKLVSIADDRPDEIVLRDPFNQTVEMLNTSYHDYRWVGQLKDEKYWVADIGNSRIKLAAFRESGLEFFGYYDQLAISENLEAQEEPTSLYYASVRRDLPVDLLAFAKQTNLIPVRIEKRPVRLCLTNYPLEDIGIDRLAVCEAVLEAYPKQVSIIVACGTATTIEVVDSQRNYIGGWILSGQRLSLRALHENTGLLPQVEVEQDLSDLDIVLGRNTSQAMSRGALIALQYTLEGLIRWTCQHLGLGNEPQVLVTGGDGQNLDRLLKKHGHSSTYIEELVCRGLKIIALGG